MGRGLAAIALGAGALFFASSAAAQAPPAKPEIAALTVAEGLQQNLARRIGEKVELVLVSGKSLTGTVKAVGLATVHLGALEGKEFYDALVQVDQIGAVVLRAK